MNRRLRLLPVLALIAALPFVASPAGAAGQDPVRVVEGQDVEREYGPIPGNWPAAPTLKWLPPSCGDGGAGSATCDNIPIEVVRPEIGELDDWFMVLEIAFEPADAGDLDIYLWDDAQNGSYIEVSRSAGSGNPEVIKTFTPELGKYNLTVVNWAGPNTGYTLKAYLVVAEFTPPFEVLAPEFTPSDGGSGFGDGSAWSPSPIDYSAVPDDLGPASGGPQFGEIAIHTDDDFAEFGESDFDREISAPAIPAGTRRSLPAPSDVPGLVAFFWLGLVPLILLLLGAFLIRRRSQASMSFA